VNGGLHALPALGGPRTWGRYLAGNIAVGAGYWLLAKLGSVVLFTGSVQAVWLPVGFAAAAFYLGSLRWFIGAAVADLVLGTGIYPFHYQLLATAEGTMVTVGNTLEVVLAAYLMRRWLGRGTTLERPRDVSAMGLALAAGVTVSVMIGVFSIWWEERLPLSVLWSTAYTWWLGDLSGGLLVTPLLLVWGQGLRSWPWRRARLATALRSARRGPASISWRRVAQVTIIVGLVAGVSVVAFGIQFPLPYIVFPALILAAVNMGLRGATASLSVALAVAIGMTAARSKPFAYQSITTEALDTQLYILTATLTTLTLGAAVSARRRAAAELATAQKRAAEEAEAERQRIARDLHDSVSQTLFTLGLHAGIARHEAARAQLPQGSTLPGALEDVAGLAQAALLEMRASIFDLRGGAVAEQGLVTALAAHGAALAVRHDVKIRVTGPESRLPLAPQAEEQLFRIGQEAITNAVKHSGCPQVSAEVLLAEAAGGDARVVLVVRDQGVSFDPAASYAGHLGLGLMRSRAADIGGSAQIVSRPGEGTTVRVSVPATGALRSSLAP
jgi:signal transduction histidine kinase